MHLEPPLEAEKSHGSVGTTATKPGASVLRRSTLQRAHALPRRLPLFAIGGIGPHNILHLLECGVERIAVSASILRSPDPQAAAAALRAAAKLGSDVFALVSRGGRPDLTGPALRDVRSPNLLIVGERDSTVLELNRQAYAQLPAEKELAIVPGATHLFEEPGALEEVTRLAAAWFVEYLP